MLYLLSSYYHTYAIPTTKLQLHYVILTTKLQLHYVIPTTK